MTYETKHPFRVATYIGGSLAAVVLAVGSLTGGDVTEPIAPQPQQVQPPTTTSYKVNAVAASCRVEVETKSCNGQRCTIFTSWGSGTLIAPGRVLTCSHLFDDGADWVTVHFAGKEYKATLLKRDPASDLALLAVPEITVTVHGPAGPRQATVTPTGYTDAVSERGTYTVIGFGDEHMAVVEGPFGFWGVLQDGRHSFTVKVPGRTGFSGGGVFDDYNRLVGVVWGGNGPTTFSEAYVTSGAPLVEFLWGGK